MLRIDTIILCVRPDESNVQNPKIVIDVHDKSVLVASDIENNAIALDKAGMPVSAFDVLRAIPVGQCRFPIPGSKTKRKWRMINAILLLAMSDLVQTTAVSKINCTQ